MSGEEGGSIRRGQDAGLSNLRAILSNSSHGTSDTVKAALEQFLDASKEERLLHHLLAVQASLTGSDDDDDNVVDESHDFTRIAGYTAVTSEQVIFLARDAANAAYDLAIDAACIDLHAVQQEPVVSVYLQITNPDAVDEEASPLELTLEHTNTTTNNNKDNNDNAADLDPQSVSQTLFDALSALVSLHPVDPNDDMMDMNMRGGSAGGMMGMGMGMNMGGEWMGADGIMDDSDVDDLMVVRAANSNGGEYSHDGPDQERLAMLDRLDNMLQVPDDLVVAEDDDHHENGVEGQFDDAEDEDDAIL
jgi:hypothetical protein